VDRTERSRRAVQRALADLEAAHDVRWVVRDRWSVDPSTYHRDVDRFRAGTVGGAGAWVTDDDGRVLLVRETAGGAWSEPSGKQEPGESLAETARREVREETGIEAALDGVALAQVVTEAPDVGTWSPLVRLVVVFAASHEGGSPAAAADEVATARWFRERPEDLLYDALAELPVPAQGDA
jgi:8-oxo-dGTP diphosphatase